MNLILLILAPTFCSREFVLKAQRSQEKLRFRVRRAEDPAEETSAIVCTIDEVLGGAQLSCLATITFADHKTRFRVQLDLADPPKMTPKLNQGDTFSIGTLTFFP